MRQDRDRLIALRPATLFLYPPYLCVLLYRVSHYLQRRGNIRLARLIWHANQIATGADIVPSARFGGGLVISRPVGISLVGVAGKNLTVMAQAGLGGEIGRLQDVGAGPGLPLLGDDVILEPSSGVLGPVRIGSRVRLAAGYIATRDIADDFGVAESVRPESRP